MNFESRLPAGLFTATLTPMNDDLSVNYTALVKHIKTLLKQGSNGICLMGTTGEANSFSTDERIRVLDEVVKAGIDPGILLLGTGTCTIPDTVRLTKHALSHNVGGILMLPPYYYKNLSDDGIVDYFRAVIEGVDDGRLNIYLYHFPKMTGVPFTVELVEKLVEAFPDEIVGMKDSGGELEHMQAICQNLPGFQLFAGSEQFLLSTLRCGGPGCISATFNLSLPYGVEVYKHWQEDDADDLQERLTKVRKRFEVGSFVSNLKYLLGKWTKDSGWFNMRPPNALPDLNTKEKLSLLKRGDFFD